MPFSIPYWHFFLSFNFFALELLKTLTTFSIPGGLPVPYSSFLRVPNPGISSGTGRRSRNHEIIISFNIKSDFFYLVRGILRCGIFDLQSDTTIMIQFKTKSGNNDLCKISLSQIKSISDLNFPLSTVLQIQNVGHLFSINCLWIILPILSEVRCTCERCFRAAFGWFESDHLTHSRR